MKNGDLSRGERLKNERKRLGYATQDDLAKLLGKSKNSVIRYERPDKSDPLNADDFEKLAAHDFDVQYLLFGKRATSDNGLSDDEIAFLTAVRSVRADSREALLDLVKTYAKHFS